jgi:hypothetical protein
VPHGGAPEQGKRHPDKPVRRHAARTSPLLVAFDLSDRGRARHAAASDSANRALATAGASRITSKLGIISFTPRQGIERRRQAAGKNHAGALSRANAAVRHGSFPVFQSQ